jgi:hypothetical protein
MAGKNARGCVPNPDYTQQDWNEVSNNPEWTAEDFAQARPFAEVFPEIAAAIKPGRGKQKKPANAMIKASRSASRD